MRLDTQPLLLAAARYALAGYMEGTEYEERRDTLTKLEGRLVIEEGYVEAYQQSRDGLALDGSSLAWERWRAEHLLLTYARSAAERTRASIRFNVELLEREVALAQQRQARALAELAKREVRA